jgi:hypothetical protein
MTTLDSINGVDGVGATPLATPPETRTSTASPAKRSGGVAFVTPLSEKKKREREGTGEDGDIESRARFATPPLRFDLFPCATRFSDGVTCHSVSTPSTPA